MNSVETEFFKQLYSEMSLLQNDGTISDIINSINYEKNITALDPFSSSLFFSGLFLNKNFYSNSFRLEFIILSILSKSKGKKKIDIRLAKKVFESINGSMVQKFEDPAEEVMVSTVNFMSITFKLLEGTWVDNAFYLQRLLDCIEKTPDIEPFIKLKKSILALLKISDKIINKAGLEEYCIGERSPRRSFVTGSPFKNLDKRNILKIDSARIKNIGLLRPFVFEYNLRGKLSEQNINHNELHKKPIVKYEGNYYLLFPNSIGLAIKNFIISFCKTNHVLDVLNEQYKLHYLYFFREEVRILGEISHCPHYKMDKTNNKISQSFTEVYPGLFIHLVYIFDNFDGVLENGFNSTYKDNFNSKKIIEDNINEVSKFAKNNKNFSRGISILVSCGYGRPFSIPVIKESNENWLTETISAPDLVLLSHVSQFNILKFFRFLDGKNKLKDIGIELVNHNGLLNLYAWAKNNNEQLIPDEVFPGEISGENKINVNIDPTSVLDLRREVYTSTDIKYIKNSFGESIKIYKMGDTSLYKEDFYKPLYVSLSNLKDKELVGIVDFGNLYLWIISDNNSHNKSLTYNIWQSLCYRAYDTILLLKDFIKEDINHIEWKYNFLDTSIPETINKPPCFEDLLDITLIKSSIEDNKLVIETTFKEGFLEGFSQEKNVAEKAIITSLVKGFKENFKSINLTLEEIITNLFVNEDGRTIHMFLMNEFTDFVASSLPKPIALDKFDDSNIKLGLAWINNKKINTKITGVKNCTQFINNSVVDPLWKKIKSMLRAMDKEKTIKALLLNHESLRNDTKHWKRTYKAAYSLHKDKQDVTNVFNDHMRINNSCSLGSRIVIEMAVCECGSCDSDPSILDLSLLISYSNLLFTLGGWSDAIEYMMVPPTIQISLSGDLLFDHSFLQSVVAPYGEKLTNDTLEYEKKKYSNLYKELEITKSVKGNIEDKFELAWVEEYGVSIDESRIITDIFEDEAIKKHSAVITLTEDEIINLFNKKNIKETVIKSYIDSLVLNERANWENIPTDYSITDILPWKFKRKLSLVSRPIIKINNNFIIAPALIRSSLIYLLQNCYEGTFDSNRFNKNTLMSKWVGEKRNKVGHTFNKSVANEFRNIGFKSESDVKLTKILNQKFDKDYGDIDVLAWDNKTNTVYLIECKDLDMAKTYGEISKQLYEFRGTLRKNGKPDRLKKHLIRENVIKNHVDKLKKYVHLEGKLKIINCLVFKTLVPLSFSNLKALNNVEIKYFEEIKNINNR